MRLRKINHLAISHLRTPFIIFLAILNSITFIFPQTCVFVTFLGCKYMQSDTSNSQLYFQSGDCFISQSPPTPPPPPPPPSCYLLCKVKRNIASRLPLIPCFQIQEYEKEIRQLRTDHANCSYEVGICQSGHTSTNQVYPTSRKL